MMNEPILHHPYKLFLAKNSKSIIVGSFPIAKFTNTALRSEIKPHEIDFFYGGEKNKLWPILSRVFDCELKSKEQIQILLNNQQMSVGDIISSCRSKNNSAKDTDLYDITWNTELANFIKNNDIRKIFFTSKWVQKNFTKEIFPEYNGILVALLSPSPAANLGIAASESFKSQKLINPSLSIDDYRIENYKRAFLGT